MSRIFFVIFFAALAFSPVAGIRAQSADPLIAAAPTPTAAPARVSPSTSGETAQATIKLLQELKTANEEILKKQQAALDTLDELQKEAEQIKIFSRRS